MGLSLEEGGQRKSPLVAPWTLLLHVHDKTETPQLRGHLRTAFVLARQVEIAPHLTPHRPLNLAPQFILILIL